MEFGVALAQVLESLSLTPVLASWTFLGIRSALG